MASALTKIDHYFTRKNKYFPHLFRRSIARFVFSIVDRRLKKRYPDYEDTIFALVPEVNFDAPPQERNYTIPAVGDPIYIRDYAKIIALSAAHFSPTAAIHLHMIGENSESENLFSELKQSEKLRGVLTTSTELIANQSFDYHNLGRYCQCVRFVRAWQFSQNRKKPILIFDIDSAIVGDLAPFINALESTDIGLIRYQQNFDPAIQVNAGAAYLGHNEGAVDFMHRASARMLLHVLYGRFTEKLDQRCLSIAVQNETNKVRVVELPLSLAGKGKDPILITGRGVLKHTSLPQQFRALGIE